MQPDAGSGHAQLTQAAHALGLDLGVSAVDRLLAYRDLLLRWNRVYNLTAVREPTDMLAQHLLDCLAVVPSLTRALLPRVEPGVRATEEIEAKRGGREPDPSPDLRPVIAGGQGKAGAQGDSPPPVAADLLLPPRLLGGTEVLAPAGVRPRILDVGSGGGLPGVVLALVEPGWDLVCVDAVAKKAAFVRQVAGELGLRNLRALHQRVESMGDEHDAASFDLITSRAFASLADFTRLTRHLLKPAGSWAAMKGTVPNEELKQLDPTVTMFHVEPLTVPGLAAQRCLVWLRPS